MSAADDRKGWTELLNRRALADSVAQATTNARSKYGAVKTDANGIRFDSGKEAKRYLELAMLQAAKEISGLKLQPEFRIDIPSSGTFNGMPPMIHIASYFADFEYVENGVRVVEDVKSKATATPVYRLKKKLVEALYGLKIREV